MDLERLELHVARCPLQELSAKTAYCYYEAEPRTQKSRRKR